MRKRIRRETPEQRAYAHAKSRCTNPNVYNYYRYGGRGIEFRFDSFADFLAEVGPRPSAEHTLDRKDNNGHYEKGNLRWTTPDRQARNRTSNIVLVHQNVSKILIEWAEYFGVSYKNAHQRYVKGWCFGCIFKQSDKRVFCTHIVSNA